MMFPLTYNELTTFVYEYNLLGHDTFNEEFKEKINEKLPGFRLDYTDSGNNGASPSVCFSREEGNWTHYQEFWYCRHRKEIIGYKSECWLQED